MPPDRGAPRGPPHAVPRLGAVLVGDLDDQILTHGRWVGARPHPLEDLLALQAPRLSQWVP